MSQRQWIVIIGVWVMIFLFLGFPSSWEKVFAILTGLLVIFMAYRIKFKETQPTGESSFTDNLSVKPAQKVQSDHSSAPISAASIPTSSTVPTYQNSPATSDAEQ
jgi:cytoskeletal protein RodZ